MGEATTRVSIDTPPLTITCEWSGANLAVVVKAALDLYREVFDPGMGTSPIAAGIGFTTQQTEGASDA